MKKTSLLILIVGLLTFSGFAQDVSFSQFYSNQLYLNPAYAGTSGGARLGLNYRNQWPGIVSKFETYNVAFDIYNPVFHGGLGLIANSYTEGEGYLNHTRMGLIQSFEQVLPKLLRFRAGYEVAFCQTRIDWSKLQFTDNLDPLLGSVNTTQAIAPAGGARNFMDFTAGCMFDFAKIKIGKKRIGNTIGLNFAHLMEPDESIMGTHTKLPRKYVVHYTMFIPLEEDHQNNRYLYLIPNLVYEQQANFRTTNIGFYVSKNPLLAGLWYRKKQIASFKDQDALILNIGFKGSMGKTVDYKLGYSYDFTINNLSANTLGAHELSILIEFKNATLLGNKSRKPTHSRNRLAECEDFGNHTLIF